MPPKTLEEARNQPGRREQIEGITKQIESQGIKYVFFQQVSVTGRVMGKGVVASFFPQVAEKGYQLVYGATANLFVDRAGDYIGFGPEESELAAIADLSTFAVAALGQPRRARVLRLLRHGDRRAARRRPAAEPQARRRGVRGGARLQLPHRHRAGDDVAQEGRGGLRPRGRHQALLLPHPSVRGASSGPPRRRRIRPGSRPRHVLRRPRGRPRPARAELPLRPPRQDGRQHHDLPPDLRRGGPQARPSPDLHAQAVHGRVGQRPPPPLHPHRRRGQQRLPRQERAGRAVATPRVSSSAACWSTSAR